jgi:hypothetical protein
VSEPLDTTLDNCGCCEPEPAPPQLYNRPGLPALAYRAGTYASFFRRMRNRIGTLTLPDGEFAGTRPLVSLSTRDQDDPSIALLDASAVMADVLTFYQERIANEGFLRTATERRSILEMAREIGYELNPGVAASVFLSFRVDDALGAPGVSTIPAGTKVQSIPPQGKLPQTFETSQELTAYKEWNVLEPRLTQPQSINVNAKQLYLQGTSANLKPGDVLLVVISSGSTIQTVSKRVVSVDVQANANYTRADLDPAPPALPSFVPPSFSQGAVNPSGSKIPLDASSVQSHIVGQQWKDADLNAFLGFNEWDTRDLLDTLSALREAGNTSSTQSVFVFRERAGFFGCSAPLYQSMPKDSDGNVLYPGADWDGTNGAWEIWKNQQTSKYYAVDDAFLERTIKGIVNDSWVLFKRSSNQEEAYRIRSTREVSLAAFGISGKAMSLQLNQKDGSDLTDSDKPSYFKVRTTTAYVQSEQLALAELPILEDLPANQTTILLNGLILGLQKGQAVYASGERADADGTLAKEILIIQDINHIGGFTELTFESGLEYPYKRDSFTLNANTVQATHGETVTETLGSGDGARSYQQFTLKKPPLTFTRAATPSGSESTMQLRVNKLLWELSSSLYGLEANDQGYIIRIDDDSKATVIFGDGQKGARLPTGVDNVTAVYRSGIGLEGEVEAGSLTLLPSKPFGVRGVINPLAASGAGDPEKMDNARDHAPLTVRTLDRVVSLDDYQDFAGAFAGIGKAQAIDLWSGEQHLVHLTIAGANGKPVTDATFLKTFKKALDAARDPAQLVKVDTYDQLLFDLTANVAVDERYVVEDVFSDIKDALQEAFSFAQRSFGQSVTAAEVISLIQEVDGVIYVDLDDLYISDDPPDLNQILAANSAHVENGQIVHAQLLLLNNLGVNLQEVQA